MSPKCLTNIITLFVFVTILPLKSATVPSATLLQIKEGTEELLVHSGVVCSSQCYVSYTNSRYIYLPGVVFTSGDLVRSRRVVDDITVLVILQQQAFNPVAFMLQTGRVSIDEKS